MRGGLQRQAAAVATARAAAAEATGAAGAAAPTTAVRYWQNAWLVASAVVAMLVVRIAEIYPRLSMIRPVFLTAGIALVLTSAFTPPSARRSLFGDAQFRRVLWFIGIAAAMVPFALWRSHSISMVRTMLLFDVILVSSILLCAPTAATLNRLMTGFVVTTSAFALVVVSRGQVVEGDRLTTTGSYDSNDLAALLCVALPMAAAMIVRRGAGPLRLVGLGCAAILAYSVTLTGSRGGLIAMVVGVGVLLGGFNPGRLVPAALALTLASPVLWGAAPETFRTRARSIFSLESDYNTQSTGGRKYIWKRGISFFVRAP
jgi:hypothetical protein